MQYKLESINEKKFSSLIPTDSALRKKLNLINLENDAGEKRLYKFTWENYFMEHVIESKKNIDRVLILYIDSKIVRLLLKIHDCTFFDLITKLAPAKLINKKIEELNGPNFTTAYTGPIIEYLILIEELEKFKKGETPGLWPWLQKRRVGDRK